MSKSISRRGFLWGMSAAGIGTVGLSKGMSFASPREDKPPLKRLTGSSRVISTWQHGLAANQGAWKELEHGGNALDAVEKGVNVSENDPEVMSVGFGGLPDREGNVTLDACIMDKRGNAGAVGFLQGYKNAVSLARKVMELTPHVMLVGEGAEAFAAEHGFSRENLLTEKARERWLKWMSERKNESENRKEHDTIGMVVMDAEGDLAGACTTSGLAWKMHGRVGDSPIIGAGLYVDNRIGGAAATGIGEECIKVCGSFLVVEEMRKGASPAEACMEAIRRVAARHEEKPDWQLAFIALNISGETGAFSLNKGFQYAVMVDGENRLHESEYLLK